MTGTSRPCQRYSRGPAKLKDGFRIMFRLLYSQSATQLPSVAFTSPSRWFVRIAPRSDCHHSHLVSSVITVNILVLDGWCSTFLLRVGLPFQSLRLAAPGPEVLFGFFRTADLGQQYEAGVTSGWQLFISIDTNIFQCITFGVVCSLSSQVGLPWFIPPRGVLWCVGPHPKFILVLCYAGYYPRCIIVW